MKRSLPLIALTTLALSGFLLTGCSTDKSQRESVEKTAISSRVSYDEIDRRLDTDLGKLRAVDNQSGTPSQFQSVIDDVRSDVKDLIDSSDATYRDVRDANESRIAHIRKDAAENSNNSDTGNAATRLVGADAASRQTSRLEKIRKYQNTFTEDSAKLRVALMKAQGALCDVSSTVSANAVSESVRLTKSSLSDAISTLKDAKSALSDLKKDVAEIRDYQPTSINQ